MTIDGGCVLTEVAMAPATIFDSIFPILLHGSAMSCLCCQISSLFLTFSSFCYP